MLYVQVKPPVEETCLDNVGLNVQKARLLRSEVHSRREGREEEGRRPIERTEKGRRGVERGERRAAMKRRKEQKYTEIKWGELWGEREIDTERRREHGFWHNCSFLKAADLFIDFRLNDSRHDSNLYFIFYLFINMSILGGLVTKIVFFPSAQQKIMYRKKANAKK